MSALALSQAAFAADWLVRAQALGSAKGDAQYSFCGSSDGAVNCSQTSGAASGEVTYANGQTSITAQGQAQSGVDPAAVSSGRVTADLSTATIRQTNTNAFASSGTAAHLADTLTFDLPDSGQVYAIAFSYSFDGGLSGDTVGEFHPGLYAQSSFELGSGSIGSTQSIGESGPDYFPPSVGLNNGAGQWTNVVVTQGQYGYAVSGDVLIGGAWGDVLAFDMQSQASCANEYGVATCDFSHTQAFGFGALPGGVTYTSASGVFLTAVQTAGGIPEPSAWATLIAGFGLAGAALRARRRTALA